MYFIEWQQINHKILNIQAMNLFLFFNKWLFVSQKGGYQKVEGNIHIDILIEMLNW